VCISVFRFKACHHAARSPPKIGTNSNTHTPIYLSLKLGIFSPIAHEAYGFYYKFYIENRIINTKLLHYGVTTFTGQAARQTFASSACPSAFAASAVYRWMHCPSSSLAVAAYSLYGSSIHGEGALFANGRAVGHLAADQGCHA
jgi:hypothetical protein